MNTAIAKKPLRQVQDVKQLLHNDQAREQLAAVAAKHMNPQRLMRVTANAIRTTPKLQECEPLSFLGALMQCASLGLEPNTVLGHAFLVPFRNNKKNITEVQVIIGYKGLIDLARRSGHITSISAHVHYSDDELWEYEEGTEACLRHRPGAQEGEKLHAYAIAKFRDGGHAYVVLPWSHVMKIRDGSQNWQSAVRYDKTNQSPWKTHEDAMAKKTAIRALSKYLPLSVDFIDAVQMDHDAGTKVDYAAYAIAPEDGPTIDGEFVEEEEGTEDEDQTPEDDGEPEDKKAETKKPESKAKTKTETETKSKPKPKADDKPAVKDKAEDEPAEEAEEPPKKNAPDMEQFKALTDMIINDLVDAPSIEEMRELYGAQIEQIRENAPDEYKRLQAEFEAFEEES